MRVGVIGTHGLPASHGAFEQTTERLTMYALDASTTLRFLIACDRKLKKERFYRRNVRRLWFRRPGGGAGTFFYLLCSFLYLYAIGVRNFNQTGLTSAVVNVMFKAPITGSDVPYKYTGMSLMFVNLELIENAG